MQRRQKLIVLKVPFRKKKQERESDKGKEETMDIFSKLVPHDSTGNHNIPLRL